MRYRAEQGTAQIAHAAGAHHHQIAGKAFHDVNDRVRRVALRHLTLVGDAGLIERQIAVLSGERLAPLLGHGLTAIVEITLERQDALALESFERRVAADVAVQQCYRVSPGPDFVLVVHTRQMPDYLALAQRLFTADANVRNVKAYFSVKRSKFGAELPLSAPAAG